MYGISYSFTTLPSAEKFSSIREISLVPRVIVNFEDREPEIVWLKKSIIFNKKIMDNYVISYDDKSTYHRKLAGELKSCQERIISDYISAVILRELRIYPDKKLVFFINDNFETEKIVGRLAYLGLPAERVMILFISRNVRDLLSNIIVPSYDNFKFDLMFLNNEANRNRIFGPYPEDDTITLLKTFYITYDHSELYPVKVDLFCQFSIKNLINERKNQIREKYFADLNTELYNVVGTRDNGKTRIPRLLVRCEDMADSFSKEINE